MEKNFIDWLSIYSNFIIHNSNKWEYIDENWNLYIFGIICMEIVFSVMDTDARGTGRNQIVNICIIDLFN